MRAKLSSLALAGVKAHEWQHTFLPAMQTNCSKKMKWIYGYCIPIGEVRNGKNERNWMEQGEEKIKWKRTPRVLGYSWEKCSGVRKQKEHADGFICSYWHIQNSSGVGKKWGSLQAGLSLCSTLSHNMTGINLCLWKKQYLAKKGTKATRLSN